MKPREKFTKKGMSALQDVDLVSILLGSGIKGTSYTKIAQKVIRRIVTSVNTHTILSEAELLAGIRGLGEVKALQIIAAIELGRRVYSPDRAVKIYSTKEAAIYFQDIVSKKREHVKALYLNARYERIQEEVVCIGSVDYSKLLPRDVIIPALECNAVYIIMAHNHPSGDSAPSEQDREVTRRIISACDIVGLKLLDHIIVSTSGWQSVDIQSV